tara:strand:+ start:93 stop:224 length:132 start_codon:yes stop_codon:yes gene_type:complete
MTQKKKKIKDSLKFVIQTIVLKGFGTHADQIVKDATIAKISCL